MLKVVVFTSKEERHLPSRFITELPPECIQEIRLRGTVTRALNQAKVREFKLEFA